MIVETIPKEEYLRRLSTYVAEEKAKLPLERRPQGFFGNWGFYAVCKKQFDSVLAREGIEVIYPPVVRPPQTGKIPG